MIAETLQTEMPFVGTYIASGIIGNTDTAGAPIAHFKLIVAPNSNSVTGSVEITRAIPGPNNNILIKNVQGTIETGNFNNRIVNLEGGGYLQNINESEFKSYIAKFTAQLNIDSKWNGQGGFSYANNYINNLDVKPLN